jgi:hypothetical protein
MVEPGANRPSVSSSRNVVLSLEKSFT